MIVYIIFANNSHDTDYDRVIFYFYYLKLYIMFSSTIICTPLKIASKAFNVNPIAAIKSLIGNSTVVTYYEVSNYIDNNLMLTINVYYKALDTSQVYYVKPEELVSQKVTNAVTPTYISDLVTIQLRAPYNEKKIVPLEVKVMDKPIEIIDNFVLTNYFARPLKSPYTYFTSMSVLPRTYHQALYFTKDTLQMSTLDINQSRNKKDFTIDDLDDTVNELNKNVTKKYNSIDLESICSKFLSIVDIQSPMAKNINNLQYVDELPETLPSSTKFAYIIHFNKKLREHLKKYKFGFLIAPNTRPYVDLVIYIPSMAFVLENEQYNTFTSFMINDIITAHNFSMIK